MDATDVPQQRRIWTGGGTTPAPGSTPPSTTPRACSSTCRWLAKSLWFSVITMVTLGGRTFLFTAVVPRCLTYPTTPKTQRVPATRQKITPSRHYPEFYTSCHQCFPGRTVALWWRRPRKPQPAWLCGDRSASYGATPWRAPTAASTKTANTRTSTSRP